MLLAVTPSSVSEQLKECLAGANRKDRFCAAALGPLAILIFDRGTTRDDAEAVAQLLTQVARVHPKLAILSVVGSDCTVPDASVRNRLTSEVKTIQKQLLAAVTVIEGSGFRAAAVRGAVTGMTLLLRASYPAKTFASVDEAGEFLDGIIELGGADITNAVELLRAHP
jgi:hypothetical protein